MNKKILAIIIAVMMAATAVCLSSCGAVADGVSDLASGADILGNVGANDEVAEYAELVKEAFGTDSMMGMKIDVTARGDSLVYVYTYEAVDSVTQEQADTIEQSLVDTYGDGSAILDAIKAECPAVESVIFEYYESDGDLVLSKEFK